METQTFTKGTLAICNRCDVASVLPKDCEGHVDHARTSMKAYATRIVFRLDTMCILPNCGHMDAHWIIKERV